MRKGRPGSHEDLAARLAQLTSESVAVDERVEEYERFWLGNGALGQPNRTVGTGPSVYEG